MLWGMARYYRHIRQGDRLVEDPEGVELPDLDAARAEALQGIRDVLAEAIKRGDDTALDEVIVIADEAGREMMTIPFADALPPRLRRGLLGEVATGSNPSPDSTA
jgi:hypothetical protein